MRPVLIWVFLIAVSAASYSEAAPIIVRSGEHDGFTRIVLSLPAGVTWQLNGEGSNQRLALKNHSDGFDINSIFSRITRKRLIDVTVTDSDLLMVMPCECEVRVYEEANSLLVLDLLNGPPLDIQTTLVNAEIEAPFETVEVQKPVSFDTDFEFGELLWANKALEMVLPRELPDLAATAETPPKPQAESSSAQNLLNETLTTLLEGVGEAATRGILNPAMPEAVDDLAIAPVDNETEIFDSSVEEIVETPSLSTNIRVTSSQDTPTRNELRTLSDLGQICPDPDMLAIQNWGGLKPFHSEVGHARSELFQEFDRVDVARAVALTKLYLFYGFGAEAKQVLKILESVPKEVEYLSEMSDIMDFGYSSIENGLARFIDCDSDIALWATLAKRELSPSDPVNKNAVLRALNKLPDHLRHYLGPEVSHRLVQSGDTPGAATVLRNVERLNQHETTETTLARAEVEHSQGNSDAAKELLKEVVDANQAASPLALIRYVDEHLNADETIPADIALLVEAYALELREDPLGPAMKRAHVLASAKSGQFEKAFKSLELLKKRSDFTFANGVESLVVGELTLRADDAVFLAFVFSEILGSKGQLAVPVSNAAAKRILDLGFPDIAKKLITEHPDAIESDSGRILLARLAMTENDPIAAMKYLEGLQKSEADVIRADALRAVGATADAYQLLQSANETSSAELTAWLSDDWDNILPSNAPVFGEVLGVARSDLQQIDSGDGMLARSETAIEESSATRAILNRLLGELPSPVQSDP